MSSENISDRKITIHTVQHLIEKCLLFYMDREECAACLQDNANLMPAVTRIVWDELEKSNVEFFAAYAARRMELGLQEAHLYSSTASPSRSFLICHVQDKENQHQVQIHHTMLKQDQDECAHALEFEACSVPPPEFTNAKKETMEK